MNETGQEASKPLLNDDKDGDEQQEDPPLKDGQKRTSFKVGSDSETASVADDQDSNHGLPERKTQSAGPSPSRGAQNVNNTSLLPRSKDAESLRSGSEIDRNSSRGSLRGPILTEPSISITEDADMGTEMKKSFSDNIPAIQSAGQNNHLQINGTSRPRLSEAVASNISLSRPGHHIVIEEVAPSASSILADGKEKEWKMPLTSFTSAKRGKDPETKKNVPKSVRRYYKTQDELIDAFEELQLDVEDAMDNAEEIKRLERISRILAQVSFVVNLALLIGKAVAAGLSGSLAVISSVIDSAVDLVSGGLMWWSGRAIKKRNIYHYPQGRTKLEPVAIVILSVVMALASVQMIRESIEKIIAYATEDSEGPKFGVTSIVICSVTIVAKFVLFLVCRRYKTPSVQALAQDHRNDVISNTGALACGLIGDKVWKYADPIGAIIISLYIVVSWFKTGWEQTKMLTGHTARPDFLKKITWISLNHHPKVMLIDTVRAFHFGNNFLVEVDIVLPEEMSLRESHDIGESLQVKIEKLQEVERAFVHLDYECEHHPSTEHKQV